MPDWTFTDGNPCIVRFYGDHNYGLIVPDDVQISTTELRTVQAGVGLMCKYGISLEDLGSNMKAFLVDPSTEKEDDDPTVRNST